MSDKKTISINTAYFKQGGGKKSSNQTRSRKPKPLSIIAPNDLKRSLIKKVKEHQHNLHKSYHENHSRNNTDDTHNTHNTHNKHNNNLNSHNNKDSGNNRFFPDEFKESLDYLVQLSQQHKDNMKKPTQSNENENKINNIASYTSNNNTQQQPQNIQSHSQERQINSFYNTPSNFQLEQVDIELPNSLVDSNKPFSNYSTIMDSNKSKPILKEDKPYGCLKNGTKPTYRTYMKTLKNRQPAMNSTSKQDSNHIKNFVRHTYKNKNENTNIREQVKEKRIKYVTKQIKTRRFKCGRSKKTRKVGVVLKSGKTRSKVLAEKQNIKARPYAQMKNEMYKKGFLKIGTNAPRDLVNAIYENSILAGDVLNKNKDVLIHNYMNDAQNES